MSKLTILCAALVTGFADPAARAADYWIVMKTGNNKGAGTDADVEIKLHGTSGESAWINLNEKGDDRERGYVNIYVREFKDIGEVKRVQIRAREESNDPDGPKWYLDRVTVTKENGQLKGVLIDLINAFVRSKSPLLLPSIPANVLNLSAREVIALTNNLNGQPVRQHFENAFRKLPGTKEFKFDCWIVPGKYADRGKPAEWTVTDSK